MILSRYRKEKDSSPSPGRQRDKKTKTPRCPAAFDTIGANTLKDEKIEKMLKCHFSPGSSFFAIYWKREE